MSYKQNKTLHYIYFRVKNTSYGILESFIKTSLIKNEKTIEFFGIMGNTIFIKDSKNYVI